jgi:hypothetical protein
MNNFSLSDIISLAESVTLECKAAQGRDGKGEVPDSFWETYSAMANTNGGEVYLGIEEKPPGVFRALASVYYLPGQKPVELPLSFLDKLETSSPDLETSTHDLKGNSPGLDGNPIGLSGNSPGLGGSSSGLDGNPIGLTRKRDAILASFGLEKIPGKMKHDAMRKLIVQLCDDSFVTLRELSKLLNRNQAFIQHDYISGMLSEGLLELKYPDNKYHPNQAYRRKR